MVEIAKARDAFLKPGKKGRRGEMVKRVHGITFTGTDAVYRYSGRTYEAQDFVLAFQTDKRLEIACSAIFEKSLPAEIAGRLERPLDMLWKKKDEGDMLYLVVEDEALWSLSGMESLIFLAFVRVEAALHSINLNILPDISEEILFFSSCDGELSHMMTVNTIGLILEKAKRLRLEQKNSPATSMGEDVNKSLKYPNKGFERGLK
jgi:hypothetical protein